MASNAKTSSEIAAGADGAGPAHDRPVARDVVRVLRVVAARGLRRPVRGVPVVIVAVAGIVAVARDIVVVDVADVVDVTVVVRLVPALVRVHDDGADPAPEPQEEREDECKGGDGPAHPGLLTGRAGLGDGGIGAPRASP